MKYSVIIFILLNWGIAFSMENNTGSSLNEAEETFLKKHWPPSIALQGAPPDHYSTLESSLMPEDCGMCHQEQYKDWQTSIHSKAMGAGVLGQLIDMVDNDPATAKYAGNVTRL